ncbi:MAG: hypothetical protein ACI9R3_006101 [Verrucomicrobiales bacterium]|jgi:hypothetical protein
MSTQTAGRRLRQWLAWLVRENGKGGVMSPRILTPPQFIEIGKGHQSTASSLEVRLAWIEVLSCLDPGKFAALFPVAPHQPNNLRWQSAIADALIETRLILGEAGLLFADLAASSEVARAAALGRPGSA